MCYCKSERFVLTVNGATVKDTRYQVYSLNSLMLAALEVQHLFASPVLEERKNPWRFLNPQSYDIELTIQVLASDKILHSPMNMS